MVSDFHSNYSTNSVSVGKKKKQCPTQQLYQYKNNSEKIKVYEIKTKYRFSRFYQSLDTVSSVLLFIHYIIGKFTGA